MASIFDSLRQYAGKWAVKSTRNFTEDEINSVNRAVVVSSQYGTSLCFYMKSGGMTFIPMSNTSTKGIGEEVNLHNAKLVTLGKDGESDIVRVEA